MGARIMEPAVSIQEPERKDIYKNLHSQQVRVQRGATYGLRDGLDNEIMREIREEAKREARRREKEQGGVLIDLLTWVYLVAMLTVVGLAFLW